MKKLKLLMPLLGVAATAGAIVPVAVSCNKGKETKEYTVKFSADCVGIESITEEKVKKDAEYSATITASTGYELPTTIEVTVGGEAAPTGYYTYTPANDKKTAAFSIPKVTGETSVKVVATAIPEPKDLGVIKVDFTDRTPDVETNKLSVDVEKISEDVAVGSEVKVTLTTAAADANAYAIALPIAADDSEDENQDWVKDGCIYIEKSDHSTIELTYGLDYEIEFESHSAIKFKVLKAETFTSQTNYTLHLDLDCDTVEIGAAAYDVEFYETMKLEYAITNDTQVATWTTLADPFDAADFEEMLTKKLHIRVSLQTPTDADAISPYLTSGRPTVHTELGDLVYNTDFIVRTIAGTPNQLEYIFNNGVIWTDFAIPVAVTYY